MTDKLDIVALEALMEKATPGPWETFARCAPVMSGEPPRSLGIRPIEQCGTYTSWIFLRENAEFIAALRNAAPALIRIAKAARSLHRRLDLMGGTPDLFWPESPTGKAGDAAWEEFLTDFAAALDAAGM